MARRKRLSPSAALGSGLAEPSEVRSERPPIAGIVADAAGREALTQAAEDLRRARGEGRLLLRLPLDAVESGHLVRDRMVADDAEMAALKASIAARGQQTPIEVEELGQGRYGLISGWRRVQALRALFHDTGSDDFAWATALVRAPADASQAYVAMVEENEIRANLSFYERARIAALAAERGVFPTPETAVRELFRHASRAKRSKILSFLRLYRALGDALCHPTAITERLGLAIVKAVESVPGASERFAAALRAGPAESAEAEVALLSATLDDLTRPETEAGPAAGREAGQGTGTGKSGAGRPGDLTLAPDLTLRPGKGRVELRGAAVDAALIDDLRVWLAARIKAPE